MASIVNVAQGTSRQLDGKPQPDEQVTETDVTDAPKLARLLTRLLAEVARLKRPYRPKRIVFTDVVVDGTGTTVYRLAHKFGGPVNWSVVGWRDAVSVATPVEDDATDGNTLAFVSYTAGTMDVLVEERG